MRRGLASGTPLRRSPDVSKYIYIWPDVAATEDEGLLPGW